MGRGLCESEGYCDCTHGLRHERVCEVLKKYDRLMP
jgi:hypothetical protein